MLESKIIVKSNQNPELNELKEYKLQEQFTTLQKELQSVRYDAEFICKQITNENTQIIELMWQDKLEEVQIKFNCMMEGNKQFIQINGFGKFKNSQNMIEYCLYCQRIHIQNLVDIENPQAIFQNNYVEIRFQRDLK